MAPNTAKMIAHTARMMSVLNPGAREREYAAQLGEYRDYAATIEPEEFERAAAEVLVIATDVSREAIMTAVKYLTATATEG